MHCSGKNRSVTDGPFAESRELVAGYWLWAVASMEEAIDCVNRCPNPINADSGIEIRTVFAPGNFAAGLAPEFKDDCKCIQAESGNVTTK